MLERDGTWFDLDRDCRCRIDAPEPGEAAGYDDGDRLLLRHVREYGWHVVQIEDSPLSPGWVFSVGMWHTLGSPEVAIFGLDRGDAANTINRIGDGVRAGGRLGSDVVLREVLDGGWPMAFRPVDPSWYKPLFGYALWFARVGPLPIVQGVWADPGGRFPWEDPFDRAYAADQPSLWLSTAEHPPSAWSGELSRPAWSYPVGPHTGALTTKRVLHEGSPVLLVTHDDDGTWQFLDGRHEELTVDDAQITDLGRFVSQRLDLMELGDLPQGWRAWRPSPVDPWRREPQA